MTENGNNLVMPVSPMYGGGYGGNGGFGWGSDIWIILLVLFAFGGWGGMGMGGFGGFGGYGNMMLGYDFPWLLNGQQNVMQNSNNGFRDAMLNDGINGIRDSIGNLSTQLCGCCGDMQMAVANGFANAETAANARQMAAMQQGFGLQTAMSQGFNGVQLQQCQASGENRLAIAGLGSDIAREACANRTVDTQNTQTLLNALNAGVQSIKDQLCQDKIDAKNEKIVELQNRLNMADFRESQTAQNALFRQGLNNEVDALYNRLSNCPVPSTPVYGRTPIFTCNQGCGCNCNQAAGF